MAVAGGIMKKEELDSFLKLLDSSYRSIMESTMTRIELDRGQYVFLEGNATEAIYLVEEGVIETNHIHGDGKVYIQQFLYPGDFFGEGVLYDQPFYPYGAMARERSVVWKIPKNKLDEMIDANPELRSEMNSVLGVKLDQAYYKSLCIAGEKVEKRIACILLKAIQERGIGDNCGVTIDTPLTNRDIAGLVGSTEETVSRVMSKLKKEGVILANGKNLVVQDREGLHRYFDEY